MGGGLPGARFIGKGAEKQGMAHIHALPNEHNGDFREGLLRQSPLRCGQILLNLTSACNGCGKRFIAEHALLGPNWGLLLILQNDTAR